MRCNRMSDCLASFDLVRAAERKTLVQTKFEVYIGTFVFTVQGRGRNGSFRRDFGLGNNAGKCPPLGKEGCMQVAEYQMPKQMDCSRMRVIARYWRTHFESMRCRFGPHARARRIRECRRGALAGRVCFPRNSQIVFRRSRRSIQASNP